MTPAKISEKDKALGRNYDRAAWFYEKSAKIYSTNQIRASKRYQLQYIEPGQTVLYLGAGAGEDAVMAARHGAKVTCCLLYTSPSPRDLSTSRMPSSA